MPRKSHQAAYRRVLSADMNADILHLSEELPGVFQALVTNSGFLCSPEGHVQIPKKPAVHPHRANLAEEQVIDIQSNLL